MLSPMVAALMTMQSSCWQAYQLASLDGLIDPIRSFGGIGNGI